MQKKVKKEVSTIPIYCKCQHCGNYFEIVKRRKYCSEKCRKAAYYRRKNASG